MSPIQNQCHKQVLRTSALIGCHTCPQGQQKLRDWSKQNNVLLYQNLLAAETVSKWKGQEVVNKVYKEISAAKRKN